MQRVPKPSGLKLPFILQKKAEAGTGSTKDVAPKCSPSSTDRNRVFTADSIHRLQNRVSSCLKNIQEQIMRGEETYFENTSAHGNLYKGWDAFVDAKEIGDLQHSRRVPNDSRWFSSSCGSITSTVQLAASITTRNSTRPDMSTNIRSATESQVAASAALDSTIRIPTTLPAPEQVVTKPVAAESTKRQKSTGNMEADQTESKRLKLESNSPGQEAMKSASGDKKEEEKGKEIPHSGPTEGEDDKKENPATKRKKRGR